MTNLVVRCRLCHCLICPHILERGQQVASLTQPRAASLNHAQLLPKTSHWIYVFLDGHSCIQHWLQTWTPLANPNPIDLLLTKSETVLANPLPAFFGSTWFFCSFGHNFIINSISSAIGSIWNLFWIGVPRGLSSIDIQSEGRGDQ